MVTDGESKNQMSQHENYDLSIFHEFVITTSTNCDPQLIDVQNCPSLIRLLTCLHYYSLLNIQNDQQHCNIFEHFTQNIYKMQDLLNDYQYFIKYHSYRIQEIHDYVLKQKSFKPCNNVKNCQFSSRHHRVNINQHEDEKINSDPNINLYIETLDSLHFYIFHLYHAGLRTVNPNKENNDETKQNESNVNHYDASFSRIKKLISTSKDNTRPFERFPSNNDDNTKFNINMNDTDQKVNTLQNMNQGQGDTYLDTIYTHLSQSKIDQSTIKKLQAYILSEEYCTESVDFDLNDDHSNIATYLTNSRCIECITDFMAASRCMFFVVDITLIFSVYDRMNQFIFSFNIVV